MADRLTGLRRIRGHISRRLLVNTLVDPDEAARCLPSGVRPHLTDGATVVGCCLLELEHVRPTWAPRRGGITVRAAAHRISVEWDEAGSRHVGVFVPVRHADSQLAVLAGGRIFPGVHRHAAIDLVHADDSLRWSIEEPNSAGFDLHVVASHGGPPASVGEPVGRACIDATLGLSPGFNGRLEVAEMKPANRRAQRVDITALESDFIASFATARPAPSFLMSDVEVSWTPSAVRVEGASA